MKKNKREVSYEEGKNFTRKMNISLFETLTKCGKNVYELFFGLLYEIFNLSPNNFLIILIF